MKILRLAWMLMRGGGRRAILGSALTFAAVTVSTAMLMFAIAGNFAFAERAERSAWLTPVAAEGTPTAIQSIEYDAADNQPITIVRLAALSDNPPTPPGMPTFPEPGQVWVSDALAELMDELPSWRLADRYGQPDGRLGADGVIHDGALIAVIGTTVDDPLLTYNKGQEEFVPVAAIDGFNDSGSTENYVLYRMLMVVATVLMAVPLLVFGGAAARLTVARRDQRLATLRLVGATPGQVGWLTAAEAMATAALGAVTGIALYTLLIPLLSLIPIDGSGWRWTDLWPQWWALAAVVVAVPLLVGVSAVIGLRRVVVSPLGVAKRETPPGMRAIRLLMLIGPAAAFIIMAPRFIDWDATGTVVMIVLLAGTFAAVNLVGPWVVWLLGRLTVAISKKASGMLAGRRLMDDPRSAWRTVAGIALVGFIAGFVGLLAPQETDSDVATLQAIVDNEQADAVAAQAEADLDLLSLGEDQHGDTMVMYFTAAGSSVAFDEFRSKVARLSPGSVVAGSSAPDPVVADVNTGVLTVLGVSMLIAMVSSAVAGMSSVLDRRQVYSLMHLAGTPKNVLNAARRRETLIPLLVMGGGSIGFGVLLALPLASAGGFATIPLPLLITVVIGLLGVTLASAVSRPLLTAVMRDVTPRPD